MATRMQQRRGTAAQWTSADPRLESGEIGFETDTNQFKIGDGVNVWSDLSYFKNLEDLGGSLDDYILITEKGVADGVATLNSSGYIPLSQLPTGAALDAEVTTAVNNHSDDTTNIHGIADTAALATKTYADGAANTAQTAAETTAASALSTHSADTTDVHGIADTSLLSTKTYAEGVANTAQGAAETTAAAALVAHNDDTTNVHGIADTSALATKTYADGAVTTASTTLSNALSSHESDTTNVHGIADTSALATKTYADGAVTTHNNDTTDVHGIADTSLLALKSEVAAVTKTTLGLGNVDNTADSAKPVSTSQASAIATAKSEAIADATAQVNALLIGAPAALNTLDELAAALGDDANYAASVTTSLGLKVDSITPISQKTASYTLSSLTERDDLIEMGSASAITLTIPPASAVDYPVGTSIDILQTGAGQVTIAAGAGVTVNATPGLKLRTQWSSATLMKRAANTWVAIGDLSA